MTNYKRVMLLSTLLSVLLTLSGCASQQSSKTDDASVRGSVGAQMQSKNLSGAGKIRAPF